MSIKDPKYEQIRPYLKCLFRCMAGMFISLLIFSALGLWLGNVFDQQVLFVLIFLLIGLFLGFYLMYIQINKLNS